MTRLYLKIPENFIRLTIRVRFLFVHVKFGMDKFLRLAQNQVDHFSYPKHA